MRVRVSMLRVTRFTPHEMREVRVVVMSVMRVVVWGSLWGCEGGGRRSSAANTCEGGGEGEGEGEG